MATSSKEARGLSRVSDRLVLGSFAAVLVFVLASQLFGKLFGGDIAFYLLLIDLALLAVSAAVVLVWMAWRPREAKFAAGLVALLAGVGVFALVPQARHVGDRLFFASRRDRLDRFVGDLLAYGRISQLDTGEGATRLNGEAVAYTAAAVDTVRPATALFFRPRRPLAEALARDGIDPARYEDFRRRLRDLKLINVQARPDYVAFLYDGVLDNLEGFLWVRPGHRPPGRFHELFGGDLSALRPLGGGWYAFGTT